MHTHEDWLWIASDDLKSAKGLLDLEIFSTSMFHCQQTAEKALKAYLAFKKERIKKTHNLVNLVELCVRIDPTFEQLLDFAKLLTPMATEFRYPSEYEIPDEQDALQAIEYAQKVFDFVNSKIDNNSLGENF